MAVPQVLLHDVALVLVLGERVVLGLVRRGCFRRFPEGLPDGVAVFDGIVLVCSVVRWRVSLLPDAVVRADAEVLHVALHLAVVGLDQVAPGLPLGLPAGIFQFPSPVGEPIAHLSERNRPMKKQFGVMNNG